MKKKLIILAIWIFLWELAALIINNAILFAGPVDTIIALFNLLAKSEFYVSLLNSVMNILLGILAGLLTGTIFAAAGKRFKTFDEFFGPFIRLLRTVPVVCFIVIFLIWFGAGRISFFIVFTVTLPLVYINISSAIKAVDGRLLEMSDVFEMKLSKKLKYVYYPQMYQSVRATLKLIAGVGFKSGAAAEVIGQSMHSIGNGIYRAKINLETPTLFAWTAVILLVSFLLEKVFIFAAGKLLPGDKN